jgi:tRNA/rRNA methyltransferase
VARRDEAALTPPAETRRASAGQRERFTESMLTVLEESGYLNPTTAESSQLKIRRLVNRMDMSAADAEVWLGIVRQILWRLRKPE